MIGGLRADGGDALERGAEYNAGANGASKWAWEDERRKSAERCAEMAGTCNLCLFRGRNLSRSQSVLYIDYIDGIGTAHTDCS